MKKTFIYIAILLLITPAIFAQHSTIHFIRAKKYVSAALPLDIIIDNEAIGRLQIGERLIYKTDTYGSQEFNFKIVNAKTNLRLNIEADKVYYVLVEMTPLKLKAEKLNDAYGISYIENSNNFKKNHAPYQVEHLLKTESSQVQANMLQTKEDIPQTITKNEIAKQAITTATKQKRLALIIGNANYLHGGALANPINDATDMANTLKGLGFDVTLVKNANQASLKQSIDNFGQNLSNYDVGLFYYAGHGLQSKGFNYFIPVDANITNEAQVEFDCVRTDRLLRVMENAGSNTNIIILDACRNNPFERSWNRSANGSGLAFMDAPSGSLIAYATSPGKTASDGSGKNGLYTSELLKYIQMPNLTIEQMFKKVRESVQNQSKDTQTPWESTSLVGEFYFSSIPQE